MDNYSAVDKSVLEEILCGLTKVQKTLPSKYFYDEKGSQLFDKICKLEEYYPTRTEMMIMKNNIQEIISLFDEDTLLVELGSGSSLKTRLLLSNLKKLKAYIPIDISEEHLNKSAEYINDKYENLKVIPVVGDYTRAIDFPEIFYQSKNKIAFFPGSTIGNFTKKQAANFLNIIADEFGIGSGMLIGIDRIKDELVLEAAYNDSKGVTAEFNLNILNHLNELLNTNFDVSKFYHKAIYNEVEERIEMYLHVKDNFKIEIDENIIQFEKGEKILTEYSHKYSIESFKKLLNNRYEVVHIWSDKNDYFSLLFLKIIS